MNKPLQIKNLRKKLSDGLPAIGGWIQIPHSSIAEIFGGSGYDWVAVDLEHGSALPHQLPDLFRAIELGNTLPFVRLASCSEEDCKKVLDAGATGLIIPNITKPEEIEKICKASNFAPYGNRGVGFYRDNLFGLSFQSYMKNYAKPLIIAMIENEKAIMNLELILNVKGLDAILIGPYDLSASLNCTGKFDSTAFKNALKKIKILAKSKKVPLGIHCITPDPKKLKGYIKQGYQFIGYSMDSVFLQGNLTKNHNE